MEDKLWEYFIFLKNKIHLLKHDAEVLETVSLVGGTPALGMFVLLSANNIKFKYVFSRFSVFSVNFNAKAFKGMAVVSIVITNGIYLSCM